MMLTRTNYSQRMERPLQLKLLWTENREDPEDLVSSK